MFLFTQPWAVPETCMKESLTVVNMKGQQF
jgi:hypothetical protein